MYHQIQLRVSRRFPVNATNDRILNSGDIVRIEPWEIRVLETRDDRVIRASVQPRKAEEVKDSKATETEIIDPEATE